MPDYSAGTASVRIKPNADDFIRDLRAKLTAMRDPGFTVRVVTDTSQAGRETAAFRQEQERNQLELDLGVDLDSAKTDVSKFRREEESRELEIEVEASTAGASADMARWRATQERNEITIHVDVDVQQANAAVSQLNKSVRSIGGGGGGFNAAPLLGLSGLAVGATPAAISGIANLAGAVQQLSQAGLVLPGVVAGATASIGTLKIGLTGVSDAYEAVMKAGDGTPESIEKATAALDGLAPAARDAVKAAAELTPAFMDVQSTLQQNIFEGLDESARTFVDKTLPTIKTGMGGIATTWNATIKEVADSLGSDTSVALLDRIFGNTADAQKIANRAIDPFTNGIGTLTAAGTDALPRIAGDLESVANRFDKWISGAAGDGRLDKWITRGVTGLEHMGNSALNLVDSFGSIADEASGDLLRSIEDVTGGWADYLSSAEGQAKVNELIAEGDEQLETMANTAQNLGPTFAAMFESAVTSFGAVSKTLEVTTGFVKFLQDNVPGLTQSFTQALNPIMSVKNFIDEVDNTAANNAQEKLDAALKNRTEQVPVLAKPSGGLGNAAGADSSPGAGLDRIGAQAAENQRKVESLGDAVRTLPNGHVIVTENTPEVISRVLELGFKIRDLPNGDVEIVVDDKAANAAMQRFIDNWNKAVINPRVSVPGQGVPAGKPGAITQDNPFAGLPPGLVPPKDKGGPTPGGRGPGPTGGFLAEVHSDEWILPKHARSAIGDRALWALTRGRSFAPGGYIDEHGNPVTPGSAPGPVGSVAPNPFGGGVGSIANSFLSGLGGPLGMLSGQLGGNGANGASDGGTGINLTPGFAGLMQAGGDPDLLDQWGQQTGEWLGNFGAKTLTTFGSTLLQGALGMVGLENSILSPNNSWNQAAQKSAGFFLGQDGPFAQKTGSGAETDPKKLREADDRIARTDGNVAEALARLNELAPDAKESARISANNSLAEARREAEQAKYDRGLLQGSTGASPGGMALPGGGPGSEAGLQVNTIGVKRAINAMFPQITDIGGVRPDRLKWHPQGLAIDVMIPGGDTASGANPAGKALGDQIYAYVAAHAGELGVDLSATLWQVKDHFNHLHIATTGGGYPQKGYAVGGGVPGTGTGDTVPAMLTPGEHVLTTDDVAALGGQKGVYALRSMLHGYENGGAVDLQRILLGQAGTPRTLGSDDPTKRLLIEGGRHPRYPKGISYGTEMGSGGFNPIAQLDTSTTTVNSQSAWPGFDRKSYLWSDIQDSAVVLDEELAGQARKQELLKNDPVQQFLERQTQRRAIGGEIFKAGAIRPPPRPNVNVPDAKKIQPRPTPPPPVLTTPPVAPPPVATPAPGPPPPPVAVPPSTAGSPEAGPAGPVSSGSVAPPGPTDHNLPWVNQAIQSGAATLGNIAQSAASFGMMAATMGASAAAGGGGGGGGMGGPSISGMFQQGGKIVQGIANVVSSAMVGSVPGSFTTTENAYGETLRPKPPPESILPPRNASYGPFFGHDTQSVMQEINLHETIESQRNYLNHPDRV